MTTPVGDDRSSGALPELRAAEQFVANAQVAQAALVDEIVGSWRLLFAELDWLQYACLQARGWVLVSGSEGGSYALWTDGRVARITPEPAVRLCVHAGRDVDAPDQLLALVAMLGADERRFLRLANIEGSLSCREGATIMTELIALDGVERLGEMIAVSDPDRIRAFRRMRQLQIDYGHIPCAEAARRWVVAT